MYILGFHVLVLAAWLAALGESLFAFWKGDAPARLAALTYLVLEVSTYVINPSVGNIGSESLLLALDFACAVIFLLLAVRFASLWLGAAMLFQAAQFSLHAYYLVMELPHDSLHAWINNADDWGIMISIVVGTAQAMRRRAALAKEEAELELRRQQRVTPTP